MARKPKKIQHLIDLLPAGQLDEIKKQCQPGSYNYVLIWKETEAWEIKSRDIRSPLYMGMLDRNKVDILTPEDLW